jgi:hypothetical protein
MVLAEPKMVLSVVAPQDPSTEAECGDGTPVLVMVPETDMTTVTGATASTTMSEETTGGPIALSSLTVRAS